MACLQLITLNSLKGVIICHVSIVSFSLSYCSLILCQIFCSVSDILCLHCFDYWLSCRKDIWLVKVLPQQFLKVDFWGLA